MQHQLNAEVCSQLSQVKTDCSFQATGAHSLLAMCWDDHNAVQRRGAATTLTSNPSENAVRNVRRSSGRQRKDNPPRHNNPIDQRTNNTRLGNKTNEQT